MLAGRYAVSLLGLLHLLLGLLEAVLLYPFLSLLLHLPDLVPLEVLKVVAWGLVRLDFEGVVLGHLRGSHRLRLLHCYEAAPVVIPFDQLLQLLLLGLI